MGEGAPALFLDRDGVVNVEIGYLHRQQDCVFMPGIFELVRGARRAGFEHVFIVTNQAGIGRGYYSEEVFLSFTDWMLSQFEQAEAPITRVLYCPHHPTAGVGAYMRTCDCRKPAPGMLRQAQAEYGVDMARSVMVGDSVSDMAAAAAAGVNTRFLLSQASTDDTQTVRVASLFEVMRHLGLSDPTQT